MILCQHWEDIGRKDSGKCVAGLYGGTPSTSVCNQCPHKHAGLGDLIAMAAKAVGIKPCKGCRKRREKLNQFGKKLAKTTHLK